MLSVSLLVGSAGAVPTRSAPSAGLVRLGAAARVPVTAPAAVRVAASWRIWRNYNSNKCMGASGGHMDNGTPIIQWTCNGHPDQYWTAISINPTGYTDQVQYHNMSNPNKCLGIPGGLEKETDGVQLVIWDCLDHPDQMWTVFPAGLLIVDPPAPDNTCMFGDIEPTPPVTVANASTSDGAAIVVRMTYTALHWDQYWICTNPG